jgi:UPF0755 protein
VPGGRSEEERERARLEREARRAGRQPPPASAAGRETAVDKGRARFGKKARESKTAVQPTPPPPPREQPTMVRTLPRPAPEPSPDAPAREPRTRGKRGRILLGFLALLLIALLWFLNSLFQPFHGDGSGTVAVNIPRSSGVGDIADLLEQKDVIASSFFFSARATIAGKRADLRPGRYVLKHDMSYGDVIDTLTKGPAPNTVDITIPEGRSRREIAASLKDAGVTGNYLTATAKRPPSGYGAQNAKDLEGFLFPATYQLRRGVSVNQLVARQLRTFKQRFAGVSLAKAKHKNLTPYDVLTIASMVERETAVAKERPLIASVIYNRLRAGTPLGIDATTRFQFNEWSKPLTRSQLASPSPYNTRIHTGLPPGPIGNPGLASIEAAAAPASSKYMFYVSNPCKPGTHTFTETLEQFNAAAARYDEARAKAGGNAPKGC